jgi:cysteine desulfurase
VDPSSSTPISPPEIYLDWNATTPLLPAALTAMHEVAQQGWGNPASVHGAGRRARAVLEETREALAQLISVHPRDVLLTSGGTEANNLALHQVVGLTTSRMEHPSVVRVAEALAQRGVPVSWLPVPSEGAVDPDSVAAALRELPSGSAVAVAAVNHETGIVQPIEEVARVAHELGAWLHVDAVQALGKVSVTPLAVADSVAVAAHKIRGPKGIGALAWRGLHAPKPLLLGGSQERGLRPGTQDAALAAGFRVALGWAQGWAARQARLSTLRDQLEAALLRFGERNGQGPRVAHVSNVSFAGWRGAELAAALDLEGVRVSSGSACSAGTSEPSVVIAAMLGPERATQSVRFSLGELTREDEIAQVISVLSRVVTARS